MSEAEQGFPVWAGIDPKLRLKVLDPRRLPRVGGDRPEHDRSSVGV